jgi:hypothetical protein
MNTFDGWEASLDHVEDYLTSLLDAPATPPA